MTVIASRTFGQRLRDDAYQCSRCGRIAQCNISRDKPEFCRACALTGERMTGTRQDWAAQALCAQVDPEVWFPERGEANRVAKAVCARCEVRAECLAFALGSGQEYGVFGGLSAKERKAMRGEVA